MNWRATTESEIWDMINNSYERMNPDQKKCWESIKVMPEKWQQEPYGNEGNGFWIVALIGNTVIWFNDIEDGFNRSSYTKFGTIDEYWCNQDQLEWTVQHVLDQIHDGYDSAGYCGVPQPIT
jgi:hypothetical protein